MSPAPPSPDPSAPPPTDADGAIADLATRLGVESAAVTVVVDEAVTWRDGSIGCPEPGMLYTQALVPGRRVVLEYDGQHYAYHGRAGGPITYCPTPGPDGAVPGVDST